MSRSPLLVLVSDLLHKPGTRRRTSVSGPVDVQVELSRTTDDPVSADLLLEALAEGDILVSGQVGYRAVHRCNRCLTEWEEPGSLRLTRLYGQEPDEDGYALEGEAINLVPLLRDEISLAFPLTPLCREDCLGLCPTCGADLNEGDCPGHEDKQSSPFAGLQQLLEE